VWPGFYTGGRMNRFQLEQQIMNCWQVCEDIDAVYQVGGYREMTEDELANALLGLKTIYQLKFEILMQTFETMIRQGTIK
jgi:hypothetical protein